MQKKHKTNSTAILDEQGKILLDTKEIVERWIRYIEELYKGDGLTVDDIESEFLVERDSLGPDIIREEFDTALKNIKNGKKAGSDGIFVELIKYANCDPLLDEIFELVGKMYTTGKVPIDFKISKTVTLPKKANTLECEEYRTLSLISQASKMLLKIIQNGIRPKVENYLGPDQYGFRQNKGTREAILALRIIIDRRMELDLDTHIAFIDLEKAFDKVNWKDMMTILRQAELDYRDRKIIFELY